MHYTACEIEEQNKGFCKFVSDNSFTTSKTAKAAGFMASFGIPLNATDLLLLDLIEIVNIVACNELQIFELII